MGDMVDSSLASPSLASYLGSLTSLPHNLLAAVETGALLGVGIVIGAFGYTHPRLEYSGGEPQ